MSSNTITPPLASQANEIMCGPREERKKRTLEEENDAVKRPKTAIAEGGANDDNNEEVRRALLILLTIRCDANSSHLLPSLNTDHGHLF